MFVSVYVCVRSIIHEIHGVLLHVITLYRKLSFYFLIIFFMFIFTMENLFFLYTLFLNISI